MKYWRTDRTRFIETHPYRAPYPTAEEAERWCETIRRVHSDEFRVIPVEGGLGVEQDVRKE